ncbi:hypothetical protein HanIR_Chr10g0483801 [Helianthus annuus]|nr:hypothetical protein HanIR_Chr10g0483801 [Helianthus annuus]
MCTYDTNNYLFFSGKCYSLIKYTKLILRPPVVEVKLGLFFASIMPKNAHAPPPSAFFEFFWLGV